MKEENQHDNDNIAELMLIVSKELEDIAKRDEIKCKFSYLDGMKRGFEIKQQEEKKNQALEKVVKEIDDALGKVIGNVKKKIVITFTDGASKNLYHKGENKKVEEVTSEIINDFNRCGENGFIAYRDVILKPNHIKYIEVFDIENK